MWYIRPLTEESIHFLHERVIEQDSNAENGYNSRGLVNACMDRAMYSYYGEIQHENIYERTAALIQGIINFHPFTDGNKRTALLTSYFFLLFHGYKLNITFEKVLNAFIDIANERMSDIEDIAKWVENNTTRMNFVVRFLPFTLRLLEEKIDVKTTLAKTNLVTLLLMEIEQEWPKNSDIKNQKNGPGGI